jgi:hypothetical protein
MLTTIALFTAGIAGAVVSFTRLCRDLMIGRLIKKLLVETTPDQRFAICERLAAALGVGDRWPDQGSPSRTGGHTLHRRNEQQQSRATGVSNR